MPRFFVPHECIQGHSAIIKGQEALHIYKVLRLKQGEQIWIFDGTGIDYRCEIQNIQRENVVVRILDRFNSCAEPPINMTLFQSLPKSDKMDLIIQKSTELGVTGIVPIITERTVVNIQEERIQSRLKRWRRIALEACKQCNRSVIPHIHDILPFKESLKLIKSFQLSLIPWEEENERGLKEVLKPLENGIKDICFLIGPEGGFTQEEINAARRRGGISVSLGPRILRTETAGMVLLSILMYELGDLGG
jgi:16S rRNA (uracil1498-N3)-methyltransferase